MEHKKKESPKSKRSPYADLGLMIALAIFIIMLIRSLVFELTILTAIWGCIAFAYLCISAANNSYKRIVQVSTTLFLLLSVALATGSVFFDRPTRPKMVAFQGSAADSIIEENESIVVEPQVNTVDTIEKIDTTDAETLSDSISIEKHDFIKSHTPDTLSTESSL